MNAVSRELSLHTLPALGPSIEIDADDLCEQDGHDPEKSCESCQRLPGNN
jgi:hypothetical protein